MLACGVLSMRDAARAVDYETIVLLFGMMVVVAYLRMAGFFALATERIAARCSGPLTLLAVTIASRASSRRSSSTTSSASR